MAASELVGRDDAVAFLDARQDFELDGIDIADGSHAAEHRVHHAGGAMDDEAHGDETVNDLLDLRFLGAFLHDNEHGTSNIAGGCGEGWLSLVGTIRWGTGCARTRI